MQVLVMGCGRVGSQLAAELDRGGHSVVVIDRDAAALNRLDPDFGGRTVVGVGFDRDVLVAAGIESADAFAAVSSGDNSNIIAARVAREMFEVPKVVARIYDAKRAEVYERLGIPTVATVPWTTKKLLAEIVDSPTVTWVDPSGAIRIISIEFDESWIGIPIIKVQKRTGARVVFVTRFGRSFLPEPTSVLQQDDEVFVAVTAEQADTAVSIAAAPVVEDET